jgi:diguanylate cyclase (GGDEF)-like protein
MSSKDGLKALWRGHTYDPAKNACLRLGLLLGAGGAASVLLVDGLLVPAGAGAFPIFVLVIVQWAMFGLGFGAMGTLQRDLDRLHERDLNVLLEMAMTDPLTGLRNRRYVEDELQNLLHRSGRTGGPVSVVYFDLDHFKEVNEREGHRGGDLLLVQVADSLRAVLRQGEILGRYGGDEFLLIVAADLPYATKLVERAVASVRERTRQSLSAGVARSRQDGTTPEELIAAADAHLMKAKARHHAAERSPADPNPPGPSEVEAGPREGLWRRASPAERVTKRRVGFS